MWYIFSLIFKQNCPGSYRFSFGFKLLRRNHSDDTSGQKNRGFKQTSTCNFKTPLQKRILIASRGRISKLTYLEFRSSFLNLPRAWYSQPVYEEAKIIGKRSIILSTTRQKRQIKFISVRGKDILSWLSMNTKILLCKHATDRMFVIVTAINGLMLPNEFKLSSTQELK